MSDMYVMEYIYELHPREVQLTNDIIFINEDGVHVIKAGTQFNLPEIRNLVSKPTAKNRESE